MMTNISGTQATKFLEQYGFYDIEISNDVDHMTVHIKGNYDILAQRLNDEEAEERIREDNEWINELYKEYKTAVKLVSE